MPIGKAGVLARWMGALLAGTVLSAPGAEPSLCGEFRQLLSGAAGNEISRHYLQTSEQPGDEEQYYNLDIDGDDVNDVVQGGCSSSSEPADPCMLFVDLSSGKKLSFEFELDERFVLVRHHSRIYALATAPSQAGKPRRSILSLDAAGITRTCSNL